MAKKKVNLSVEHRKLIYLLVTIAVIVSGGLAFINSNRKDISSNPRNSISEQNQPSRDTENDGVYTNEKYGFSFTYPADIFQYQNNGSTSTHWLSEARIDGSPNPITTSDNAVSLRLIIRDDEFVEYDADGSNYMERHKKLFEEFEKLEEGQKSSWGAEKLSQLNTDSYRRVIFHYKTPLNRPTEKTEYYGAWWHKNNYPVIVLEYSAGSSEALSKNKALFETVVDSFKFTEN